MIEKIVQLFCGTEVLVVLFFKYLILNWLSVQTYQTKWHADFLMLYKY
jgi:hypothetical protein